MSTDAFGRLRVSNPTNLLDTQFQYDKLPFQWNEDVTSGGAATHVAASSRIQLSTNTTASSRIIRQSKQHVRYQPGKSQLALFTFVLGAFKTNVTKRVGLFNDDNGIFLELTDEGLHIVRRSKSSGVVVNTRVNQLDWNLRTLHANDADETIELDHTKAQILVIDMQWLGVGRVRVGFDLGGQVVYVHEFDHANDIATTYMTTANLPARYEQENTGVTASNTDDFYQICCSVISEGGWDVRRGISRAFNTDPTTAITVSSTALTPLFSIRPKTLFNSIANRINVIPLTFDLINTSANPLMWQLILNPATLTSATWAEGDSDSAVEVDDAATALTGGTVLATGYASAAGASGKSATPIAPDLERVRILLARSIDNTTADELTFAARGLGGAGTAFASGVWKEEL